MRATILAAAAIVVLFGGILRGEDAKPAVFHAKPFRITSTGVVSGEAMAAVTGFGQNKPGFEISYLIEGEDLIGVKKNSLEIKSIMTGRGKDISKKRNGKIAYDMGSFPKASDDGKYCVFSIEVDDASQFGKVEQIKVNGSIVALLGTKREDKTVEVNVNEKKETKAGLFSIQVGKPGAGGGMFGALTQALGGPGAAPSAKDGDKSNVGIKLTGPMSSMIEAKFKDGDHELQSCYSYDDKSRDYTFPKPKSGKLTVILSYWADMKEAEVRIGE